MMKDLTYSQMTLRWPILFEIININNDVETCAIRCKITGDNCLGSAYWLSGYLAACIKREMVNWWGLS